MNWSDRDDPPHDADIGALLVVVALIVLFLFVVVPRLVEVWP